MKQTSTSPLKEELTTKMHSELTVDKSTKVKHHCWSALTMIADITNEESVSKWADVYDVSVEDIKRHAKEYYALKKKKA